MKRRCLDAAVTDKRGCHPRISCSPSDCVLEAWSKTSRVIGRAAIQTQRVVRRSAYAERLPLCQRERPSRIDRQGSAFIQEQPTWMGEAYSRSQLVG